jgi:cell division septation protein DedD
MLSGDENETKPLKKSARKGKADQDSKKAEPRKRKPAPRKDAQPEQVPAAAEAVSAPVTPAENTVAEDSVTEVASSEVASVAEVAPAEVDQAPDAQLEQLLEAAEEISTAAAPIEPVVMETPASETSTVVPLAAAEAAPVSYQAIADEYRRYTTESLDRTQTFFGRLAGVRSLDKAFELQSEFARQAYDGFVAESRKIRELHSQLAKQRLQQWEGFVARMIGPR